MILQLNIDYNTDELRYSNNNVIRYYLTDFNENSFNLIKEINKKSKYFFSINVEKQNNRYPYAKDTCESIYYFNLKLSSDNLNLINDRFKRQSSQNIDKLLNNHDIFIEIKDSGHVYYNFCNFYCFEKNYKQILVEFN